MSRHAAAFRSGAGLPSMTKRVMTRRSMTCGVGNERGGSGLHVRSARHHSMI